MLINLIGAGKLATTLGKLIIDYSQLVRVSSVYARNLNQAQRATKFIGYGQAVDKYQDLAKADVYCLLVSDNQIATVCDQLLSQHLPNKNALFIHFSGYGSNDLLRSASELGYLTASLHPLQSFTDPRINLTTLNDVWCGFAGSATTRQIIEPIFSELGAKLFDVDQQHKALYHAASVIASNYLVTLAKAADDCFRLAKIKPEIAQQIVTSLLESSLKNLKSSPGNYSQALTGPLKRGDSQTITGHLNSLPEPYESLYKTLAKFTLPLTDETLKAYE